MSEALLPEDSNMAANAICHAAYITQENIRSVLWSYERPSVLYRPKLYPVGNMWCALYGEDLREGCAGFGETPAKAMADFDRNWENYTLPPKAQQEAEAERVQAAERQEAGANVVQEINQPKERA